MVDKFATAILTVSLATVAAATPAAAAPIAEQAAAPHVATPVFTFESLEQGDLVQVPTQRTRATTAERLADSSYAAMRDSVTGAEAVVDTSVTQNGVLIAVSPEFVDLSWKPDPKVAEYLVYKGEDLLTHTSATGIRDEAVAAGGEVAYRIEKVAKPDVTQLDSPVVGVTARVPTVGANAVDSADQIQAAAVAAPLKYGSWFRVKTFIPQAKIDAPPAGCDYGGSYQFHGDGRTYSASSSAYRTSLTANLRWDNGDPRLIGSSTSIGETIVYRKSSGAVAARRTASGKDVWVKELGSDADQVDLRFSVQARNPFCSVGSIAGAFTLNAYKNGNWAIRSGSHRQMPNWEVYAGWIQGPATTVYRRPYANAVCLVNMACPEAQMGATTGSY